MKEKKEGRNEKCGKMNSNVGNDFLVVLMK